MAKKTEQETEVKTQETILTDISNIYVPTIVGEPGKFQFKSPIGQVFEATYLTAEPYKDGFAKVTKIEDGSFYVDLAGVETKEKSLAGEQLLAFLKGEIKVEDIKYCDFGNPNVAGFVKAAELLRAKMQDEKLPKLSENKKINPETLAREIVIFKQLAEALKTTEQMVNEAQKRQRRVSRISNTLEI